MKSTLTLDIRSYAKQDILNNQTSLDLLSSLYKLELVSKINMPTRKRIWTVLSGPHVHKKSREQFQYFSTCVQIVCQLRLYFEIRAILHLIDFEVIRLIFQFNLE